MECDGPNTNIGSGSGLQGQNVDYSHEGDIPSSEERWPCTPLVSATSTANGDVGVGLNWYDGVPCGDNGDSDNGRHILSQ